MTSRKSREAILECLEYVISLFPDNNRGYNLSRTYRKALKEYLRENSMNHERKKNTIAEKISASKCKIRMVSKNQSKLNREMEKIRKELPDRCCICGREAVDPAHLLPRSMYPEYYTARWNVVPMCREHHRLYDNDIDFRMQQKELYNIVLKHDECAAHRYFKLYEL